MSSFNKCINYLQKKYCNDVSDFGEMLVDDISKPMQDAFGNQLHVGDVVIFNIDSTRAQRVGVILKKSKIARAIRIRWYKDILHMQKSGVSTVTFVSQRFVKLN